MRKTKVMKHKDDKKALSIFGVKIDNLRGDIVKQIVAAYMSGDKCRLIATVNPEILLLAAKNERYRKVISSFDLRLPDGFGVNMPFFLKGEKLLTRLTGVDLAQWVLQEADNDRRCVFLVARKGGLSSWKQTKKALILRYPKIDFHGLDVEPNNSDGTRDVLGMIRTLKPDILLCNFGAPDQELFLSQVRDSDIRLGIGIGGAFDYWTGAVRRAPQWMRRIGLEWLWRLKEQPRRFPRIIRAVIVFPIYSMIKKVGTVKKEV